ncbi:MAG: sigma-70 family RNA polymerase sigma factor [Ruminiclostridium sp.]|nr:sigma-70 family RNA polymerase sigma factor [Ruminiclostridium sp.]
MPEENKYTLLVNKKRIPVTEEVYRAYYQLKEREDYLDKLSQKYNMSFEECEEKGIQVDYLLASEQSIEDNLIEAEDKLIKAEMLAKLTEVMGKLSGQELSMINELFFKGKSERQLARQLGVYQYAVHKRKVRILEKLKKLLEI